MSASVQADLALIREHIVAVTPASYRRAQEALARVAAELERLERERDERGPFFVRDMARIAGLPDDASMDEIADRLGRLRDGLRETVMYIDRFDAVQFDSSYEEMLWTTRDRLRSLLASSPGGQEQG